MDNRIKLLFDGLRIINECGELSGAVPSEGEDPFFCLLEDDELITEVRVTTDRLLTPTQDDEHIHEVVLIINVKANVDGVDVNDYATNNGKIIGY